MVGAFVQFLHVVESVWMLSPTARPDAAAVNERPRSRPWPPQGPKTLAYNPAENALLITSDVDGGSYELYAIPKEAARGDTAPVRAASAARVVSHVVKGRGAGSGHRGVRRYGGPE